MSEQRGAEHRSRRAANRRKRSSSSSTGAPPGPSGPPGPPGSGVGAGAVLTTEDDEGTGTSNRGGAVVALVISVAATVFIV